MSKINSPRAACEHILAVCVADGAAANAPGRGYEDVGRALLRSECMSAAREGLDSQRAPAPAPVPPVPMPLFPAGLSPVAALELLVDAVGVEGRHFLSCDWLRGLAREGLKNAVPMPSASFPGALTPAQAVADQLLEMCFEYAEYLDEEMRVYADIPSQREPVERKREVLGVLLAPLRPLPPPTYEELAAALRAVVDTAQRSGFTSAPDKAAEAMLARVPK